MIQILCTYPSMKPCIFNYFKDEDQLKNFLSGERS